VVVTEPPLFGCCQEVLAMFQGSGFLFRSLEISKNAVTYINRHVGLPYPQTRQEAPNASTLPEALRFRGNFGALMPMGAKQNVMSQK